MPDEAGADSHETKDASFVNPHRFENAFHIGNNYCGNTGAVPHGDARSAG